MGFEDDMDDWREEKSAKPPLTEDEKAAIEKAEQFAHLNRGREVFFSGNEGIREYIINGKNDGSNIIIDVCDDEIHTNPTHRITKPIDDIFFDRHAARAAQARDTIGNPSRVKQNRARQFAQEHEGASVEVEGREEIFTITGRPSLDKVEITTEYTNESGHPAKLTTSVNIEEITLLDDNPKLAIDDDPSEEPSNVRQLFSSPPEDDGPGF